MFEEFISIAFGCRHFVVFISGVTGRQMLTEKMLVGDSLDMEVEISNTFLVVGTVVSIILLVVFCVLYENEREKDKSDIIEKIKKELKNKNGDDD